MIDTHAHLDHLDNLREALENAHKAGVSGIVSVGVDLTANQKNLEIQKSTQRPAIYVALGIHPGNINPQDIDACFAWIREHIREAVAIGETGLDYWYKGVKKDEARKDEQRRVFQKQLDLAKEYDLPVVIHSRGAWRDCFDMTRDAGVKKAVFHWYSGPLDILKEIMDYGYYVGTTPSVAYSPQSREAMRYAPVDKTLLETDCPVSYGQGEETFRSEPKDVFRTLRAYAELKNMPEEKIQEMVTRNALDFFGIS